MGVNSSLHNCACGVLGWPGISEALGGRASMWIKTQFDVCFQIRELVLAQSLQCQNSQGREKQES